MAFTVHTVETAPPESREALAAIRAKFGGVPRAAAIQAESPTLLNGFRAASAAFEATSLPPEVREAVILAVAHRNGCETCVRIHTGELSRIGRADVAQDLDAGTPPRDPAVAAAIAFVGRLFGGAGRVGDAELQEFLDAGFTRRDALDIVFGVGVYTASTFANRLVGA
ncbi:carboxymuconolactone decarboxylase family protein [Tsukamurella sputi]|uniref:Carboxymuconolactone decarboxylase family protein n=1 Tax=Tsukamurella sputi TaxID=2591848 RepID=A0A5C5RTR3_9ACTN|nr:carboxymuconolactone decarboxylase family protein [Tsukamurella sputi]TWS26466.1 carboxymuconolactone decarboxylase family protein [Tsukamurella sputi]